MIWSSRGRFRKRNSITKLLAKFHEDGAGRRDGWLTNLCDFALADLSILNFVPQHEAARELLVERFVMSFLSRSRVLRSVSSAAIVASFTFAPIAWAQDFDAGAIQSILKDQPKDNTQNTNPPRGADRATAPSIAAPSAGNPPPLTVPAAQNQPAATKPAVQTAEPAAPKPAPEELYLTKDPRPTFTAETVELTEEAARKYLAIVEAGGWPQVPAEKLVPGVSGPAVVALKKRLAIVGDLDQAALPGDVYDATVEAAVKRYQERQGLEQTGAVGGQTLRALNTTAIVRYNQLLASARRLRETKFGFGPRYVVVNIPSANVEAIENGVVVRRYIAVVGKPDHASPTVATKIISININPTWTVPSSIVKNEMIPHIQANPGYLAKEHIRIFDPSGAEINPATIDWAKSEAKAFTLRQDSGVGNSLGTLRIDMPNKDAVYMHDTPSKSLFASSLRFGSHGCVRVSKVQELAAWLMENNTSPDQQAGEPSGWTTDTIGAAITLGTRINVKLVKPVPVAWVYLTGYATPDHVVHFRSDVYNLDNSDMTASIPPRPQKPQQAAAPQQAAPQQVAPQQGPAGPKPSAGLAPQNSRVE